MATNSSAAQWGQVDNILSDGLDARLFPGSSLYVGDLDNVIYEKSVGDSNSSRIYDIASLTKIVATTISIMILEEKGDISLSDKVKKYFPEFSSDEKDKVTLEDLMRHRAGLPSGASPLQNESLDLYLKRITSAPLNYTPKSKTVYSDLSFILLGRIVEIVSGKKLSEFSEEHIYVPLKMKNTSYGVSLNGQNQCAPTSPGYECVVHDPTANHFLPATLGNAGVFSSLEDLALFGRMILSKGELNGVRILSEETFSKMILAIGPRGLGWDFTSEYSLSPRGEVFPEGISFGHTGYTGTTIWLDPKSKTYYVFLSNRVYMGDERTKKLFSEFRKKLSTAIGKIIYSSY